MGRFRAPLAPIKSNRLGPGHVGIVRHLVRGGIGRAAAWYAHDKTVDADRRHRPVLDIAKAVLGGDPLGDPLPGGLRQLVAIASTIIGIWPEMFGCQSDHDEYLPLKGWRRCISRDCRRGTAQKGDP